MLSMQSNGDESNGHQSNGDNPKRYRGGGEFGPRRAEPWKPHVFKRGELLTIANVMLSHLPRAGWPLNRMRRMVRIEPLEPHELGESPSFAVKGHYRPYNGPTHEQDQEDPVRVEPHNIAFQVKQTQYNKKLWLCNLTEDAYLTAIQGFSGSQRYAWEQILKVDSAVFVVHKANGKNKWAIERQRLKPIASDVENTMMHMISALDIRKSNGAIAKFPGSAPLRHRGRRRVKRQ